MLSEQIDEELYKRAPHLKVVANLAVGYDNIDVSGATKRGIAVCNTPDVLTETTADLTFSLLLMTARRLVEAVEVVKSGNGKVGAPYFWPGLMCIIKRSVLSGWEPLVRLWPDEPSDFK